MYLRSHLVICLEIKTVKPRRRGWTDRRSMLLGFLPITKPNGRPAISSTASKENKCGVCFEEEVVIGQTHCWRLKFGHTSIAPHNNMSGNWDLIGLYLEHRAVWALRWCMYCTVQYKWGRTPVRVCPARRKVSLCYSVLMYLWYVPG